MKKLLKIIGLIITVIILATALYCFAINESLPKGIYGKEADELAKEFGFDLKGAVMASDAFFPFVDGIEKLVQSGVTAVIQPSGSMRDKEIIKFANETNTILIFSKTRHFRH